MKVLIIDSIVNDSADYEFITDNAMHNTLRSLWDWAGKSSVNISFTKEYEKEGYGQTLAVHGVGPGCYLVLPVLGPKTARDTLASTLNFMGGDAWYNITVANDTQHVSEFDYYASRVIAGVDFRAKNYDSIENLQKNSLDFYASVKSVYLQDRQQKILNSNQVIESMDDSDWEEIGN